MPELATVALSVGLSLISALVVAYTNNRFQRDRDEARVQRETGKKIIFQLAMLDQYYIDKHNFALACRNSNGKQNLSDKFGVETETFKTMNLHESEIYALTMIHFPCCNKELKEWRSALGRADAFYRMFANGNCMGDSDSNIVWGLLNSSQSLRVAIAKKIDVTGLPFRRLRGGSGAHQGGDHGEVKDYDNK